jgi:glycogen operon protein
MVFYNGDAIPEPDPRGQRQVDDSFLVVYNGHHEALPFTLPSEEYGPSGRYASTRRPLTVRPAPR